MTYHVDIPESVASGIRLPPPEVERRLRTELAMALYAQSILPFGKACELAGISRYAFAQLVAERDIPRHYTEGDLTADLEYARGQ
jgi:predicted HTH domain antitoxin